jgi:hypothetical protein
LPAPPISFGTVGNDGLDSVTPSGANSGVTVAARGVPLRNMPQAAVSRGAAIEALFASLDPSAFAVRLRRP